MILTDLDCESSLVVENWLIVIVFWAVEPYLVYVRESVGCYVIVVVF